MTGLRLYLFGAPRLERDGVAVTADTRKALALLAYLAVTGRDHTRDTLAALLWGDADEQHARGALRRTLSVLRSAAGDSAVEASGDTVRAGHELWCDVVAFRAAVKGRDEELARAIDLCRARFMSGFSLRDSPDFEEWQFLEGEALERELGQVLGRVVAHLAARGDYAAALGYAHQSLGLDPLNEEAHRLLMRLYTYSGDQSAAFRQYRECVRILEQELGVSPLPETTQLYHDLRENRIARPEPVVAPASSAPTTPSARGPESIARAPAHSLVGRSDEWKSMVRMYGRAATGSCVALEGEAGIGKTRLAEDFIEYARGKGAEIAEGRCYEGETGMAYAVVVQVLRCLLQQSNCAERLAAMPHSAAAEAARLLPDLAPAGVRSDATPLSEPGAGVRFLDGLCEFLAGLCPCEAPTVLFFDDLHWADTASLDFLSYFVRRLAGRPVFILLAWRTDGSPPVERMRQLMAEVSRSQAGVLLPLQRLGLADVMAMVAVGERANRTGGDRAERIYRESEGVPLFVTAYLDAAAAGSLPADGPLPQTIRDLLSARLANVEDTERQLLQAAAVLGRSFDLDVLQATSGRTVEETLAGMERLAARGLIHEVASSGAAVIYDFDHEKLRSLVYETTGSGRRRLLHERAGRAWLAIGARRRSAQGVAALAAYHLEIAGQEVEAAEQHLVAARQAEHVYANADAISHYRSAIALGHGDFAAIHEAIGDLEALRGDYAAAIAAYETAAARLLTDATQSGRVEQKLANLHAQMGDWNAAESYYGAADAALRHAGDDVRAGLYADWALTLYRRGLIEEALSRAEQALAWADAAGDPHAAAQAHNVLGVLKRRQGSLEEAIASLEQSCEIARRLGDPGAHAAALNNLALAVAESGDLERGVSLLRTALEDVARRGDRHREAALRNNVADLLHALGREDESMAELKRAVALFAEIGAQAGEVRAEIWKLIEW